MPENPPASGKRFPVSLDDPDAALMLRLRGHLEVKTGERHGFADVFRKALHQLAQAEGLEQDKQPPTQ